LSTDILNKIEQLIEKFAKFSENEDINFIDCVNPDENAHTRILIKLLRSNDEYLNSFVDFINSNYNFYLPQIDTTEKEFTIEHNKKNIDGLIKDSKTAIIIENKVKWATDQHRQLARYVGKVFCNDDMFLIDIENKETEKIIDNLPVDDETKNILKNSMLNKNNESELELLCLIDKLENNKINNSSQVLDLLKKEINQYENNLKDEIKKIIEALEGKRLGKNIKRENIYVLYLVPNDIKEPSYYSYTTATKIFLNDDISSNGRFIKITYKQILNWLSNLKIPAGKQLLHNSICLYINHINNYIEPKKEKNKIIGNIFEDNYNQMQNCLKILKKENVKEEDRIKEDGNFRIKEEIINAIDIYLSIKMYKIFNLIKNFVTNKDYEDIKTDKQHFFRFIPKGINVAETKESFKDWGKILGFEFKIHGEKLILSFCVISKNKWNEKDISQNRELIDNIIKKLKGSSEYKSIKTYVEKYNDTRWIIEKCFELPISELIGKQDDEIKGIIENNFLKNPKFKDFEESLNIAFQNR